MWQIYSLKVVAIVLSQSDVLLHLQERVIKHSCECIVSLFHLKFE